eukprot:gnl/MRDRNA2_/MRDRNA2_29011_c0_seq1.p1 gnl/MRDRNA2_/MRDRNA2_29011_c0~~gnl/MRDRNA2_/MRDRNA2_29011_c0_seq1.p1  ORF type:complete len:203 (-),score=22.42 gnl/MRDRNA2_/MRDRNA2_29011_c0_seq1:257-865(-)
MTAAQQRPPLPCHPIKFKSKPKSDPVLGPRAKSIGRPRSNSVPLAASLHGYTMAGLEALMVADPALLEGRLSDRENVEEDRPSADQYEASFAVHMRNRQSTLYPISGAQPKVHESMPKRRKSSCTSSSSLAEVEHRIRSRSSSMQSQRDRSGSIRSLESGASDGTKTNQISFASEACNTGKDSKRIRPTLHAFAGAMVVSAA